MFKFLGLTQFLEICATAKKIMLFHDNGFVLLRFAFNFSNSSIDDSFGDVVVAGKMRPNWVGSYLWVSEIFLTISFLALLVLNFERYLATYYPIFHRTSVTRGRLLTLLATLIFLLLTFWLSVNENVISYKIYLLTGLFTIVPMMLFTNFKLFIIARKNRSGSRLSPQTQWYSSFSSKHISSCLLALLCVIILSIPFVVYIVLKLYSEETKKFNNVKLAGYWARTILLLSNTFNSLIFYWKNKRAEGLKVIKGIKLYRPYPSQADN
jgi:hypothetical protein